MRHTKNLFYCFISFFLALALLVPTPAVASWCGLNSIEVVGQNDPAIDISAVQDAVDNYKLVILKGTFDFDSTGSVTLTKDVTILGTKNRRDNSMTTIKGGTQTLYCDDPDVKILISQIRFDGATFCAIRVRQCSSVKVLQNEFVNIVAGLTYGERGDGYYDAVGVIIGGKRIEFYNRANIYCKKINVSGNYFDCGSYDESGQLINRDVVEAPTTSRAMRLYHCVTERVYILGNKIENHNRIGIDVLDTAGTQDKTGVVNIAFNDITTGPYAARGGWSYTEVVPSSYGMHCLVGFASPGAIYVKFRIKYNTINVSSTTQGAYGFGIYMFPAVSDSVVANNTFNLGENATGGISLLWVTGMGSPIENQPHDNIISNNKFTGTVTPAVIPLPLIPGYPAYTMLPAAGIILASTNSNTILDNDFTELIPVPKQIGDVTLPAAHIYLVNENPAADLYNAYDNVIGGSYGIVLDMTDDFTTPEYDGLNTFTGDLTVN